MKRQVFGAFLACGIGSGLLLTASMVSSALAQTPASPQEQFDALIQAIKAHKQVCDDPDAKVPAPALQCANEKTSLLARQKMLNRSNDDIRSALAGKVKTRGWRTDSDPPTKPNTAIKGWRVEWP